MTLLQSWGEASLTALGFFWKAGWAFVLGYGISAMIQAFVPKQRLTRYMGDPGPKSVALATGFGAASSSCSFAALAAARSLVLKGAEGVPELLSDRLRWIVLYHLSRTNNLPVLAAEAVLEALDREGSAARICVSEQAGPSNWLDLAC